MKKHILFILFLFTGLVSVAQMAGQDYKDQVNMLAKIKIDYAIQSVGGYRDLNEPIILCIYATTTNTSNAKITKARKALKWYYDTWATVDTHLNTIGATTNLSPQTFINSLILPTL